MNTYIAFYQGSDLRLDTLCLSQEAFVNGQVLHTAWPRANIINSGVGEALRTREQVFRVASNVVALCLDIGKGIDCQPAPGRLGQVFEGNIFLPLFDHEMNDDE